MAQREIRNRHSEAGSFREIDLGFRSVRIQDAQQSVSACQHEEMSKTTLRTDAFTDVVPTPFVNGWKNPQLTTLGLYYPLGPCQLRLPLEMLHNVLDMLLDVFRRLSMHASYQESPICAICRSLDQVEFTVSLFASRTSPQEIIVEVERRYGDVISYHNYARRIACALNRTDSYPDVGQTEPPCFWNRKIIDLADSVALAGHNESIAEALEITYSLISNERYDARRLGLESLIHMTDPYKSGFFVASAAAKSLLFPKDAREQRVSRDVFEYACKLPSDDCSESSSGVADAAEADLSYLGLIVASQTLQIAAESKSINVESFLATFPNDLVGNFHDKMLHADTNPHMGYYAVQAMVALCDCIPSLRSRINNRDVEEAQLYGDSCHLALARASNKLLLSLLA